MKFRYMVLLSLCIGIALSVGAFAATNTLQSGLTTAASTGGLLPANSDRPATELTAAKIGAILQGGLQFVGILFMILTLYGGFVYMTAGGDQKKVEEGRKYLIDASIGLAIIAASYAVTSYILTVILK